MSYDCLLATIIRVPFAFFDALMSTLFKLASTYLRLFYALALSEKTVQSVFSRRMGLVLPGHAADILFRIIVLNSEICFHRVCFAGDRAVGQCGALFFLVYSIRLGRMTAFHRFSFNWTRLMCMHVTME